VQEKEAARREYRTAVFDTRRWARFQHRPGDVFVCTPPKCGTTWMQTIVASLLWPDGDAPGPVLVLSPWIEAEFIPLDPMLAMLETQPHRRFMKSHTPADGVPFFETASYIVVGRDGRDAFMSMCNHLERFRNDVRESLNENVREAGVARMPEWNGDVHGFFQAWMAEGFHCQHIASFWEHRRRPNVLFVHYNDLKADLEGEMRRVAAFLGQKVPESRWKNVVGRCRFESMRRRGAEIGPFEEIFDGGTESFIFKGTNGRWRGVLSPDELEAYDRHVAGLLTPQAAAWMAGGRRAVAP
jgi:aryl sulfotransferase